MAEELDQKKKTVVVTGLPALGIMAGMGVMFAAVCAYLLTPAILAAGFIWIVIHFVHKFW